MTIKETERLAVIETKIDNITDKMQEWYNDTKKCTTDHEERLRKLELNPVKKWNSAVTALIGALVGGGVTTLINFIK